MLMYMQPTTRQKCAAILLGLSLLALLTILKENDIRIWAWLTGQ
jgi:hypothetical protein